MYYSRQRISSRLVMAVAFVILVTTTLILTVTTFSRFASATYVNGIGYNLMRPKMGIPQQAHQVQYPPEDTSVVATRKIKEAALICDSIAPVLRAVQCEIHTYDECGNPFGYDFNMTQGWDIAVEELESPGSFSRLVSPIIWLENGVGRFYWTPLRRGLHKVYLTRKSKVYNKGFTQSDLLVPGGVGPSAGFVVWVRDNLVKGSTAPLGDVNQAVQRMLWTQASRNAEPAAFPPSMPATLSFEDKEHRFDDRRYGQVQQGVRRPAVQPEAFPRMPDRPARPDDNNHRLVDYVRP